MNPTHENATPRPWIATIGNLVISNVNGVKQEICQCSRWPNTPETIQADIANAALIVTAVNEHEALCKVAKMAFEAKENGYALKDHDALCEALAALAKLKGEK